jgi:hypothetical protein
LEEGLRQKDKRPFSVLDSPIERDGVIRPRHGVCLVEEDQVAGLVEDPFNPLGPGRVVVYIAKEEVARRRATGVPRDRHLFEVTTNRS